MPVSLGQAFRVYVKNTGRQKDALIIRKRGVNRKSAKVKEINEKFKEAKISTKAREMCLQEASSNCIYVGDDGEKHCKIECLVVYMSKIARQKLGKEKKKKKASEQTSGE